MLPLVVVFGLQLVSALPPLPMPPPLSAYQRGFIANVSAAAAPASAQALPALLAALDDAEFRAALSRCCPAISMLGSRELFQELEAGFAVTEQVHNIRLGSRGGDLTLEMAQNLSYFPNLWEVAYMQGKLQSGVGNMQAHAEEHLFGFAPFANESAPTWVEASQRPIYIAFNLLRVSLGNPIFGAISFVFKPAAVKPMTFIAPVDTGIWEMSCNHSSGRGKSSFWGTNCSNFDGARWPNETTPFVHWPLGTMEHHAHLYLQNIGFWNLSYPEGLALLFGRMFNRSHTNITGHALNFYMEANLAGNPPLKVL